MNTPVPTSAPASVPVPTNYCSECGHNLLLGLGHMATCSSYTKTPKDRCPMCFCPNELGHWQYCVLVSCNEVSCEECGCSSSSVYHLGDYHLVSCSKHSLNARVLKLMLEYLNEAK